MLIKLVKRLLTKRVSKQTAEKVIHIDPHAPRKSGMAYPNDRFAQGHISEWLDSVLDKHHG